MTVVDSKTNQATQTVQMIEHFPLFHDQDHRALIMIEASNHCENWLIESEGFQNWLSHRFYTTFHQVPNKAAIRDAIAILKSVALREGEKQQTFLRAGHDNHGRYFLDLGNKEWSCVEITAQGWQLQAQQPVAFRRGPHQQPLPIPIHGGNMDALWDCINIPEEQRILIIAWLLDALRTNTNFPILLLEGEQGSAKSTTQRLLKQVIDPAVTSLRTAPKKLDDMFIASGNDFVLSFNNLSYLSPEQQDALCNMATGGSFTTRTLYTNDQESVIHVQRPVMMNGIAALVTQPDLLERCLYFELPTIPDNGRKTEDTINQTFAQHHPYILGALLDIFVRALAAMPTISTVNQPRMADYNLLGRAVAVAMNKPEHSFDECYHENQRKALIGSLDASPIYSALVELLVKRPDGFTGNFSDLLYQLQALRHETVDNWPKNSKALANQLKRIAPPLRKVGIVVHFHDQRQARGLCVSIYRRD